MYIYTLHLLISLSKPFPTASPRPFLLPGTREGTKRASPLPNMPCSYLFSAITSVQGDLVLGGSLKGRENQLQYFNPRHQKIDIISTLTPLIVAGVELRKP